MKLKLLILIATVIPTVTFSQIYVSANDYIYVNDEVVYNGSYLNLQNNAEFFLRDEGQLIQGTAGVSANEGAGVLSVYQEGTSGAYEYNYWSSPVGNPSAAAGNENFGIGLLNDADRNVADADADTGFTPAVITGSFEGQADPLAISSRWIYTYEAGTTYSDWNFIGGASNVPAGLGFTMKGTQGTSPNNVGSNQRYDFRGKPNDGTITVNVGTGASTLTGNPYPSALDVAAFILDPLNSNTNGTVYYWDQAVRSSHYLNEYEGGYGTWVPGSTSLMPIDLGTFARAVYATYDFDGNAVGNTGNFGSSAYERRFAPIGQGFMIEGTANATVTLNNSHRVYYKESSPFSVFHRGISDEDTDMEEHLLMTKDGTFDLNEIEILEVPTIYVLININNTYTRELALAYRNGTSIDHDFGADGKLMDALAIDAYFAIAENKYTIQSTAFDLEEKVPLGIDASTNATIDIKVGDVKHLPEDQGIYLYDALEDSYTDIREGIFSIALPSGTLNDRFSITLTANDRVLSTEDVKFDEQISVIHDNVEKKLVIKSNGEIDIKSIALFNSLGQRVLKNKGGGEDILEISTKNLQAGMYIAYVSSKENVTLAKKILIK
ncbi:T9SS type A sorting domain-containing protein [Sungkyunkwania multivorans]|uniref:T9SS type A sorting domain-containing protein n=1 Tax=Sungkyunkwania multivorans TaxID=1173618 RepID=A0ABW3CT69_9FLAO